MQSGSLNYIYGRALVTPVNIGTDSSFIRVEHNFVKPDAIKSNINNYRLGDQHYWKVDGILAPGFLAHIKFNFNGKKLINASPGSSEYCDTSLTKFTADSIIVLYRKNTADDWTEVHSYKK